MMPHSAENRDQDYRQFVTLLARNDLSIRRFVRCLLPSRDGVDDVMQETALECWKKFADFQTPEHEEREQEFVRWACVIARYKVLSRQRDQARDRLVFSESVIERLAQTAMDMGDRTADRQLAVEACLQKFAPEERKLILSVHSPGQSVAAIATATGVRVRRLYSRLNSLRELLLECVRQQMAGEV